MAPSSLSVPGALPGASNSPFKGKASIFLFPCLSPRRSNPRSSHCDCLLAETLWARLYSPFWTVFSFPVARNGSGSPEVMEVYCNNSRDGQKDRDLVTQPSFVETQRPPSGLTRGWNAGSAAPPPPVWLAPTLLPSPSRVPSSPALAHGANSPSFVALEFSVSLWIEALMLLRRGRCLARVSLCTWVVETPLLTSNPSLFRTHRPCRQGPGGSEVDGSRKVPVHSF